MPFAVAVISAIVILVFIGHWRFAHSRRQHGPAAAWRNRAPEPESYDHPSQWPGPDVPRLIDPTPPLGPLNSHGEPSPANPNVGSFAQAAQQVAGQLPMPLASLVNFADAPNGYGVFWLTGTVASISPEPVNWSSNSCVTMAGLNGWPTTDATARQITPEPEPEEPPKPVDKRVPRRFKFAPS